jgi:hypothetical protein
MATGNVYVTVVDVGQGQCTFIQVYNTDSPAKLEHTVLVDCGTDSPSTQTNINLQYIVNMVSSMAVPAFDCIIFSHSDDDHISLTASLLSKFSSSKKPVVRSVWYGGDYSLYTKGQKKVNILDELVKGGYCLQTDIKSTGSNYSGYNTTSKSFTHQFWSSTDNAVKLFPIVSNILSNDPDWEDQSISVLGKYAEAKNRVSIICGLYYANTSYVICGDATNKTMAAVNTLFSDGTTVFDNNIMTTLPHHGSRATGYAVPSTKKASDKAVKVVRNFGTLIKSKTLTVSAYLQHRHPSLMLMNDIKPTLTTPFLRDPRFKSKNVHGLSINMDIKLTYLYGVSITTETDCTIETQSNTFSTLYYLGKTTFYYNLGDPNAYLATGLTDLFKLITINPHACWAYVTAANGTFNMGGYPNLDSGAALFTSTPLTTDTVMWVEEPHTPVLNMDKPSSDVLEQAPPNEKEGFQIRSKNKRATEINYSNIIKENARQWQQAMYM